jgi:hypothetical protein
MKDYWVVWMYCANYHIGRVRAGSPEDAVRNATLFFSGDFAKNAEVFVWEAAPVLAIVEGERGLRHLIGNRLG